MTTYKAVLIGCSRMGAFIDNEVPSEMGPYSHAAGYEACSRTRLVACSDLRSDVMAKVGERYDLPMDRQYVDYRQMIEREQPDIVSVATQPEHRAEIVVYAAEHGARAIYAEKALAASMSETDAIVDAVERHGVVFNLGTNRRWDTGYDTMRQVIDSGRLGSLRSLVLHQTSALFNGASHGFDLLLRLNADRPVDWVQAHLANGDSVIEGDVLTEDPIGHGIIQFQNGVTAYALNTGRGMEMEAVCEHGVVTALGNGRRWQIREPGAKDYRGRDVLVEGEFPAFAYRSPTLGLIEDLVQALDTGNATRCGVQLARANSELIFAFVASHVDGGRRVNLPLEKSNYRLWRVRDARQPKYERSI